MNDKNDIADMTTARPKRYAVRIRVVNVIMIVLGVVLSVAMLLTIQETAALVESMQTSSAAIPGLSDQLSDLLFRQEVLTGLLLVTILVIVLSVAFLILLPLNEYISLIEQRQPLVRKGAYELQFLSEAYNEMYEENERNQQDLLYEAERDGLTGLFNRGAFDKLLDKHEKRSSALILFDVDHFKEVNDDYGHDVGDDVLKKLAELLMHTFRSSDCPCRIGGDEFAVIMADASPALVSTIATKVSIIRKRMADGQDGVPSVTLSVGVSFSELVEDGGDSLMKCADIALYEVKNAGRNGICFHGISEPTE